MPLVLQRHPVIGSFCDLDVKDPEKLLACRHLTLSDVRFPIATKFRRHLDSYRGSLYLPWLDASTTNGRALVDALVHSKVHLDVFYVNAYFGHDEDEERARSVLLQLTSVSCNKMIWHAENKWTYSFTHQVVQQSAVRLSLLFFYTPDQFETWQDLDRESAGVFELSRLESVQALDWTIVGQPDHKALPSSYKKALRNLGKLSTFRFNMLELVTVDLLDEVLENLSPPTTPSLFLEFANTEGLEARDIIHSRLCSYVRNHPSLERFQFDLLEKYTDEMNADLHQLAGDNKCFRQIRDNPTAPLTWILRGRTIQRPPVLFYALKNRISELANHM